MGPFNLRGLITRKHITIRNGQLNLICCFTQKYSYHCTQCPNVSI